MTDWLSLTTLLKANQVLNNQSLKIHKLLKKDPGNQIAQEIPQIIKQPVEQHAPQEDAAPTLKRSTRTLRSAIPSDYIVYLQESDYNVGAEMILKHFHKV